jgi:hypothetical protein
MFLDNTVTLEDIKKKLQFVYNLTRIGIAIMSISISGWCYYEAGLPGLIWGFLISVGLTLLLVGQTNAIMYHLAYHQKVLQKDQ